MATNAKRDMKSLMNDLRDRSPELDQRVRESEVRRKLALLLVEIRRGAGLTQKEVAAAMGRDQAFISRMESTVGPFPNPKSIEGYAHACNAAAGYVFAFMGHKRIMTVSFGDQDEAEALQSAVGYSTDIVSS